MDFGNLQAGGQLECVPLDPKLVPPLFIMWADSPSESGKVSVHGALHAAAAGLISCVQSCTP